MKRLMLAALALFTFSAVTFAQPKPTPKPKAKPETTKKAAVDSTKKMTTVKKVKVKKHN